MCRLRHVCSFPDLSAVLPVLHKRPLSLRLHTIVIWYLVLPSVMQISHESGWCVKKRVPVDRVVVYIGGKARSNLNLAF